MKTKNPFTTYLQGYSGLFWGCGDKRGRTQIVTLDIVAIFLKNILSAYSPVNNMV